jgi:hypothetical protein
MYPFSRVYREEQPTEALHGKGHGPPKLAQHVQEQLLVSQ